MQVYLGRYEKNKAKGVLPKLPFYPTLWEDVFYSEIVQPQRIKEAIEFCFGEANAVQGP